jgi:hypothetical protein
MDRGRIIIGTDFCQFSGNTEKAAPVPMSRGVHARKNTGAIPLGAQYGDCQIYCQRREEHWMRLFMEVVAMTWQFYLKEIKSIKK